MDNAGSSTSRLARPYTIWFSGFIPSEDQDSDRNMTHVMEPVAEVETVEDFWAAYQYLLKPNEALSKTCYHVFKQGIKPIWEDDSNKDGGRWHIWFPKGQTNKLWEDLLLHLIGNQFTHGDSICGIEVRIKPRGDSLSIWHSDASDLDQKEKVKEEFLAAIGASDAGLKVEYHKFQESIAFEKSHRDKKNSGFERKAKAE
uniref:Uncharacterized protein n=1 Tax=Euplotes crassus TaxID=5936 RepID=A0A7S3NNN2_EUPCR|mmetsp:Transcript_16782/g.16464  ORF Transcript_16782/g.16464 Transcript_16782/m.16464 type:complete len:200 (+) Transcript_16782:9-608(+)